MTEEEFRKSICEKYADHFKHFYTLFKFAEEAAVNYRNFTTTSQEASVTLIFGRALKSFDSIRRLCEVALCEDAAVVLRSLLNLLAVTRWISLDPELRSDKYLWWYWVQMHLDAEQWGASLPPSWVQSIERHYETVRQRFEYKDSKGRIRMPDCWYQPEANTIRDIFVQTDLEKQYEESYRPLSGIEHSDSSAFFAMVALMERAGDEKRIEIHSDLFVPHYLRNAFQYFADIFRICNQAIPLAPADKLEAIASEALAFYKADMVARGIAP